MRKSISYFASANKQVGDILDLTEPGSITVKAEDGSLRVWSISSFVAAENPLLDNGNLYDWYQTASDYYESGNSAENNHLGYG